MLGTRRAAIDQIIVLGSVTDDSATTVIARWCQQMDRTFERIKCVFLSVHCHGKRLVVVISANITFRHGSPLNRVHHRISIHQQQWQWCPGMPRPIGSRFCRSLDCTLIDPQRINTYVTQHACQYVGRSGTLRQCGFLHGIARVRSRAGGGKLLLPYSLSRLVAGRLPFIFFSIWLAADQQGR